MTPFSKHSPSALRPTIVNSLFQLNSGQLKHRSAISDAKTYIIFKKQREQTVLPLRGRHDKILTVDMEFNCWLDHSNSRVTQIKASPQDLMVSVEKASDLATNNSTIESKRIRFLLNEDTYEKTCQNFITKFFCMLVKFL